MNKKLLLSALIVSMAFGSVFAQLQVTANNNAAQLAQVLAGTGVTISNATVNCSAAGLGTFSNGNTTNLGITSGVVLTTGTVAAIPQAASAFASTDNANGTDANLNAIATSTTQDVCVLTFQIVPQGNTLKFDYVFGSEEYPEYVCSDFNDVFGFFISGPNPGGGPAYNANNIALIPGTGTSVAINTVNPGTPGSGYAASGCQSLAYSSLYTNNTGNQIVYDGFTHVFQSQISVVPCQTYTLKLAIGDVFDGIYDSGVFLQASSFQSQTATVVASVVNPAYNTMFEGCIGGQFAITMPDLATSSTAISYTMSGTATNGVDYATLSGTAFVNPGSSTALVYVDPITDGIAEGTETVTLTVLNPCTGAPIGSATLNLVETPNIVATTSASSVCRGTSVQLGATGAPFTNYTWSPAATVSNPSIANPSATPTVSTTYTVSTQFGTCVRSAQVNVDVIDIQATAQGLPTNNVCPNDTVQVGVGVTGSSGTLSYAWSPSASVQNSTAQITEVYPPGTTNYSVTVTEQPSGCSATSSVTINVYNLTQPSLGPNQSICPENASSPVVLSPTGGPYSSFDWSTSATTPTISVTTFGTYDVTVVETSTGCELVSSPVTISYFPVIVPSLSDTGFCPGQSVDLAVNPGFTNILWSNSSTSNSITVSNAGNFYYTAQDQNGCNVKSDTISVSIGNAPVVNATASPDTICAGSNSVLSSGAVAGLTYLWQPTGASTSSTTVTLPGVYIVAVSDQFCTTRDTVEVYQFNVPQISIGSDQQGCASEGAAFTLTPTGGPFTSYNWSNAATSPSITVNTTGSYNVSVIDPNSGCEVVSNTVDITIFPQTIATLADTGMCPGQTVTLSSIPNITGLLWSTGASTPTIVVAANGVFYYTALDVNDCPVLSDTATVTMGNVPTINATASPDTICAGGSTTLSSGAAAGLQYLWTPGNQTTSSITVNQAGTYYLEVNDNFCPSFDTVTVYQFTHPPVLLTNDTTVCPGVSVTVAASGAPYVSYLWSNNAATPTISVSTAGNYSVQVNDGNCTYPSDTFTLSNIQVNTPLAFSDTTVCEGQEVILTSEAGYSNYGWSNGLPGANSSVTSAGTYSYTATDNNNCTVTSTSVVVSTTPLPNPNIVASPPVLCLSQNTSTLSAGSVPGLTYLWLPSGETTPTIVVGLAGTYVLAATQAGCIGYDTLVLAASDSPVISLSPFILTCGDSVVLNPTPGSNYTYSWSNQSNAESITITTTNNLTETYSVTATNSDGCTATSSSTVVIKEVIASAFANPDTIIFGDSSQLCVTTSISGTYFYQWTPVSLVSSPESDCTFTSPREDQTYQVIVSDADGCTDTTSVIVYVVFPDNVAVPNAFTPNNDGKNDYFYPVLLGSFQKVSTFRVYNRWGELVHDSTDPWDGAFKSSGQPAGTYIYYIVVTVPDIENPGKEKDLKYQGSFTLLR